MPDAPWKDCTLDDLVETNPEALGGSTPPRSRFRYIDINSVTLGKIDWHSVPEVEFRSAPSRARRVVRPGDTMFCTVRPSLQAHAYADWADQDGYICSTGFAVLRPKQTDKRFIFHTVFSEAVASHVRRREVGSSYPAVNESDLKQTPLRVPELEVEQSRIGEILDTLDAAIRETEAVVEKLRQVKAGLLHDLVTRGLDDHGNLRDPARHPEQFQDSPIGHIPKAWDVVRIGEEAEIEHGFAFSGKCFTDKPIGTRLLVPGNFHRDGGLYFTPDNTKYFSGKFPAHTVLQNGDVLVVMTDLSPMTLILGRTVMLNEPFPVLHNQRIGKFRFKRPDEWNPAYFVALMNDERLRRRVIRDATGTTVRHTSPTKIKSGVGVRPKREEQDQVVAAIMAEDARIAATAESLSKLHSLKRGLAHDLLTGRVRVKTS